MMTAVGVCDLFRNYVDEGINIKWPNDIYWRDRKAAGILIENLWQGSEWKSAVAGIGINVNQTDFGALSSRAVSLSEISGKKFEPMVLAKHLCTILEKKYRSLKQSAEEIVQDYRN